MTNKEKKQPQQIPASWKKSIFSNGRIYKKKDYISQRVSCRQKQEFNRGADIDVSCFNELQAFNTPKT